MQRFLSYLTFLLTLIGAILTLLQSVYLVELRFGLFPFSPQSLEQNSLVFRKTNVAFIQHMITLLLIIGVIEISLLWLLVILGIMSKRQGLIATLVLIVIVGFAILFAFSASIA